MRDQLIAKRQVGLTEPFDFANGLRGFLRQRGDYTPLNHLVNNISPSSPSDALWTAQQIIEAFPEETAPRFLLRDRDQIYGEHFPVGLWEWALRKS